MKDFFRVVHVQDSPTQTLKDAVPNVLYHHEYLYIHNIQMDGYNGTSNMRAKWNGLQVLIYNKCLYC